MAVGSSIVDYLKSQGQDSSYAARKQLAESNGISNYSGTADQNISLLKTLQKATAGTSGASGSSGTAGTSSATGESGSASSDSDVSSSVTSKRSQYLTGTSEFSPSEYTSDYLDRLSSAEDNAPDGYSSQYSTQIDNILNSILNREAFSYDMDNDQLYQQYKDQYIRQGQQAMRDTMGNAAALTGGYGSSYATTAGSQAYDSYLQQLNDKVPELYQLAYQTYQDQGTELYNQLSALENLDNIDYSRYRDDVSDYYTNLNYLSGRYDSEYNKDYTQYSDALSQQNFEDQFAYTEAQDALAQQNWQTQFDYQKEQDALQLALSQAKLASSGSSGKSSSSSGKSSSTASTSDYSKSDYVTLAKNLLAETDDNNEKVYDSGSVWGILRDMYGLDAETIKAVLKSAGGDAATAQRSSSSKINYNDYFANLMRG